MADRTGGDLIRDFLGTFDIPYVFGNPGTTETTFLAAVAASKATYILALHESSAVGIAAGYALITGKPSIVSLHTYPGLANGMFNMRNALMAGVPLLVVNGQQDSRFLIHNPVLGAPNAKLAETATKYSYEVTSIDDLAVALQRCYLQARLQPTGPVFLSIPMNFMLERTEHTTFKKTRIIEDAVPQAIGDLVRVLKAVPAKRLAIVADYAVGAAHGLDAVSRIATVLGADIYAAPFHVQGTVDPLHPNFRGQLPPTTKEINETLSRYQTMLLIGEKIDTFTYDGRSAMPSGLQVIQIAPATSQLGFDYPCDIAVLGEIKATLDAVAVHLGWQSRQQPSARLMWRLWKQNIPGPANVQAIRSYWACCATSIGRHMSSRKALPRTPSCKTWRLVSASATFISRRAEEAWGGPCRSGSG
jgi:benzoylformate decarboxylase